jgi:hypothetical protein
MKVYIKSGKIVAWHDGDQDVPASAYGGDVVVKTVESWSDVPNDLKEQPANMDEE